MLLNDSEIAEYHARNSKGQYFGAKDDMIKPFVPNQVREIDGRKCISFGLSSTGYDIRLSNEYRTPMQMTAHERIDTHNLEATTYHSFTADEVTIQPGFLVLGRSVEWFNMPNHVCAQCVGKSTLARTGIVVNVTPLEVGWRGFLTIEISNTCQMPVTIYSNEGIAQLLFFKVNTPLTTYADKNGKYQNQQGVQIAKL